MGWQSQMRSRHIFLSVFFFSCWNHGRPKGIELDVGVGELGRQFLVTDHTA